MSLEAVILDGLTVIAFAITNRIRGGGIDTDLPGSGRNYAAPMVAVLAWLAGAHSVLAGIYPHWIRPELADAVLYAICWFAWAILPWGNWITLGFEVYVNTYKGFTKLFVDAIDFVSFGNPFLALGLRMLVGLVPVAILFSPWYLALAPLMVGCYFAGWMIRRHLIPNIDAIAIGELLTGSLAWGLALVGLP